MTRYQQASYLTSAATIKQLPPDQGAEVAFIGRSNAGKSSALNSITGIKGLARISKTPGRTQMINFFELGDGARLVDLPGYGYAKVPRTIQERWVKATNEYLEKRQSLRGLVLVMDIRHPLKDMDRQLIEWTIHCGVPLHVLLTKSDKLKPNAARKTLKAVYDELCKYPVEISLQTFSSLNRDGVDDIITCLDEWFKV